MPDHLIVTHHQQPELHKRRRFSTGSLLARLVAGAAWIAAPIIAAAEVPLGHPDYQLSAERPIGWRGDGNGAFPGASVPSVFSEGTLVEEEFEIVSKGKTKKVKKPVFADDQAVNLVWKTEMPGFSNSQPIVIGRQVIACVDPAYVVSVDIDSGSILWQRELDPFVLQGLPAAEAGKARALSDLAYCMHAITGEMVGNYTRMPAFKEEYREPWSKRLTALQRLVQQAESIAPGCTGDTAGEVAKTLQEVVNAKPGDQIAAKEVARASAQLQDHVLSNWHVKATTHWDGWTGFTFPVPTSDGAHIYVSMGQGQVACLDLAGELRWTHFVPLTPADSGGGKVKNTVYGSPSLIGDVLICPRKHKLIAFDKHTGKMLWEAPESDQAAATGKALRLSDGTDVYVGISGAIYRPQDGKVLGELGYRQHGGNGCGASVLGWGDIVYFSNGEHRQDNGKWSGSQGTAWRLTSQGDDAVSVERLWSGDFKSGSGTEICHNGRIYRRDKPAVVNIVTGETISEGLPGRPYGGYVSPILAGNRLVTVQATPPYIAKGSDRAWRPQQGIICGFTVIEFDASLDKGSAAVSNHLGGVNKPRMPRLEQYIPELYEEGLWSDSGATPVQFGYGSPFAMGNRLFYLSCSHLYCIGDPQEPYPGQSR